MFGGESRYQPVLRFVRGVADGPLARIGDPDRSFRGAAHGFAPAIQLELRFV